MELENNPEGSGVCVSVKEFSLIVQVDETAIYHAIRKGRLTRSVVLKGNKKKILVYEGCIEWFIKRNSSKDRTKQDDEDIEESRKRKEYFQSLITKLDYKVKSGQLVSIQEAGKIGSEVCLAARRRLEESRDRDCYRLPEIKNSDEARDFLKARDNDFLNELSNLPDLVSQIRQESRAVAGE